MKMPANQAFQLGSLLVSVRISALQFGHCIVARSGPSPTPITFTTFTDNSIAFYFITLTELLEKN
jgi:hypothetical protein